MSTPNLQTIPALVAQILKDFTDLAALTPRNGNGSEKTDDAGHSLSSIVNTNEGDIQSLVEKSVAQLSVAVAILIESADDDESQSRTPFYNPVNFLVEIYELVESNKLTATTTVVGTGTGLPAWTIADRVIAALKHKTLSFSADGSSYDITCRKPTIQNVTSSKDAEMGVKILRCHFSTKCTGAARATD